jgi:2'-5' RNA ligase
MAPLEYALVTYVHDPAGRFVENLRRELNPAEGPQPAHITILPPRPLTATIAEALEMIERQCADVTAFTVTLGDVETFMPRTPTVFIRVAHGAYRMRELHDRLNTNGLQFNEPFPYMPHLTLFKMDDAERARQAMLIARGRWDTYPDGRSVHVEQLSFVRGNQQQGWEDLGHITLGKMMATV